MTADQLTLLAVHGNGGGGFRFERIKSFIPEEVTFEAVTLPGFASVPPNPDLKTVRHYAQALRDVSVHLDKPEREGKLVMLGTGIGGSFALEYAQLFPLDGLILHAPVGTRLEERLFPRLMRLPGMAPLGQWIFSSPLTRPLLKRLMFLDFRRIPNDFLNRFFDEYRACRVFGQMFQIIDSAWWNGLRPISIPSALLWGERERILSVDQLEDYKKLLLNHRVRTISGWDHFPMIEQPEEYAQEIVALARELVTPQDGESPLDVMEASP